ncbi:hypothetical protein ACFLUC_00145 [Chloroflexota bacterium]
MVRVERSAIRGDPSRACCRGLRASGGSGRVDMAGNGWEFPVRQVA